MVFQNGDIVLYNNDEYEVIFVYSGTGNCEIRGKDSREQHLVSPHELKLVKKKNT
jgi:hypothetical protein